MENMLLTKVCMFYEFSETILLFGLRHLLLDSFQFLHGYLVLTHCNFLAACLTVALQGKLHVDCPLSRLSSNFFGIAMIAQSKLVLHSAICLRTCNIEKNPLQVAEIMLYVGISRCNSYKTAHTLEKKNGTLLCATDGLHTTSSKTGPCKL